jgi:MtN3 and saliva related transmembrane protein
MVQDEHKGLPAIFDCRLLSEASGKRQHDGGIIYPSRRVPPVFGRAQGGEVMDLTQIIGFVAGFGTTFAALPDLLAMLKRRSSAGMNPRMAAITGSFQILWVIYGATIGSMNIVMWNVIAIATNYLTVGAYMYFRRQEART